VVVYTREFVEERYSHYKKGIRKRIHKELQPFEEFQTKLFTTVELNRKGSFSIGGSAKAVAAMLKESVPYMPAAVFRVYKSYVGTKIDQAQKNVGDLLGFDTGRKARTKLPIDDINNGKLGPVLSKSVLFHPSQTKEVYSEEVYTTLIKAGVKPSAILPMSKDAEGIQSAVESMIKKVGCKQKQLSCLRKNQNTKSCCG